MFSKFTLFTIKEGKKFNDSSVMIKPDSFIYNNSCVYDFFDKEKSHFSTQQPYQFLGRINYAYDCFLLSMHYDLFLTYHMCYFNLGSSIKVRISFPFYKFNR
jgi:hypothetical protein